MPTTPIGVVDVADGCRYTPIGVVGSQHVTQAIIRPINKAFPVLVENKKIDFIGAILKHGDSILIGSKEFRWEYSNPNHKRLMRRRTENVADIIKNHKNANNEKRSQSLIFCQRNNRSKLLSSKTISPRTPSIIVDDVTSSEPLSKNYRTPRNLSVIKKDSTSKSSRRIKKKQRLVSLTPASCASSGKKLRNTIYDETAYSPSDTIRTIGAPYESNNETCISPANTTCSIADTTYNEENGLSFGNLSTLANTTCDAASIITHRPSHASDAFHNTANTSQASIGSMFTIPNNWGADDDTLVRSPVEGEIRPSRVNVHFKDNMEKHFCSGNSFDACVKKKDTVESKIGKDIPKISKKNFVSDLIDNLEKSKTNAKSTPMKSNISPNNESSSYDNETFLTNNATCNSVKSIGSATKHATFENYVTEANRESPCNFSAKRNLSTMILENENDVTRKTETIACKISDSSPRFSCSITSTPALKSSNDSLKFVTRRRRPMKGSSMIIESRVEEHYEDQPTPRFTDISDDLIEMESANILSPTSKKSSNACSSINIVVSPKTGDKLRNKNKSTGKSIPEIIITSPSKKGVRSGKKDVNNAKSTTKKVVSKIPIFKATKKSPSPNKSCSRYSRTEVKVSRFSHQWRCFSTDVKCSVSSVISPFSVNKRSSIKSTSLIPRRTLGGIVKRLSFIETPVNDSSYGQIEGVAKLPKMTKIIPLVRGSVTDSKIRNVSTDIENLFSNKKSSKSDKLDPVIGDETSNLENISRNKESSERVILDDETLENKFHNKKSSNTIVSASIIKDKSIQMENLRTNVIDSKIGDAVSYVENMSHKNRPSRSVLDSIIEDESVREKTLSHKKRSRTVVLDSIIDESVREKNMSHKKRSSKSVVSDSIIEDESVQDKNLPHKKKSCKRAISDSIIEDEPVQEKNVSHKNTSSTSVIMDSITDEHIQHKNRSLKKSSSKSVVSDSIIEDESVQDKNLPHKKKSCKRAISDSIIEDEPVQKKNVSHKNTSCTSVIMDSITDEHIQHKNRSLKKSSSKSVVSDSIIEDESVQDKNLTHKKRSCKRIIPDSIVEEESLQMEHLSHKRSSKKVKSDSIIENDDSLHIQELPYNENMVISDLIQMQNLSYNKKRSSKSIGLCNEIIDENLKSVTPRSCKTNKEPCKMILEGIEIPYWKEMSMDIKNVSNNRASTGMPGNLDTTNNKVDTTELSNEYKTIKTVKNDIQKLYAANEAHNTPIKSADRFETPIKPTTPILKEVSVNKPKSKKSVSFCANIDFEEEIVYPRNRKTPGPRKSNFKKHRFANYSIDEETEEVFAVKLHNDTTESFAVNEITNTDMSELGNMGNLANGTFDDTNMSNISLVRNMRNLKFADTPTTKKNNSQDSSSSVSLDTNISEISHGLNAAYVENIESDDPANTTSLLIEKSVNTPMNMNYEITKLINPESLPNESSLGMQNLDFTSEQGLRKTLKSSGSKKVKKSLTSKLGDSLSDDSTLGSINLDTTFELDLPSASELPFITSKSVESHTVNMKGKKATISKSGDSLSNDSTLGSMNLDVTFELNLSNENDLPLITSKSVESPAVNKAKTSNISNSGDSLYNKSVFGCINLNETFELSSSNAGAHPLVASESVESPLLVNKRQQKSNLSISQDLLSNPPSIIKNVSIASKEEISNVNIPSIIKEFAESPSVNKKQEILNNSKSVDGALSNDSSLGIKNLDTTSELRLLDTSTSPMVIPECSEIQSSIEKETGVNFIYDNSSSWIKNLDSSSKLNLSNTSVPSLIADEFMESTVCAAALSNESSFKNPDSISELNAITSSHITSPIICESIKTSLVNKDQANLNISADAKFAVSEPASQYTISELNILSPIIANINKTPTANQKQPQSRISEANDSLSNNFSSKIENTDTNSEVRDFVVSIPPLITCESAKISLVVDEKQPKLNVSAETEFSVSKVVNQDEIPELNILSTLITNESINKTPSAANKTQQLDISESEDLLSDDFSLVIENTDINSEVTDYVVSVPPLIASESGKISPLVTEEQVNSYISAGALNISKSADLDIPSELDVLDLNIHSSIANESINRTSENKQKFNITESVDPLSGFFLSETNNLDKTSELKVIDANAALMIERESVKTPSQKNIEDAKLNTCGISNDCLVEINNKEMISELNLSTKYLSQMSAEIQSNISEATDSSATIINSEFNLPTTRTSSVIPNQFVETQSQINNLQNKCNSPLGIQSKNSEHELYNLTEIFKTPKFSKQETSIIQKSLPESYSLSNIEDMFKTPLVFETTKQDNEVIRDSFINVSTYLNSLVEPNGAIESIEIPVKCTNGNTVTSVSSNRLLDCEVVVDNLSKTPKLKVLENKSTDNGSVDNNEGNNVLIPGKDNADIVEDNVHNHEDSGISKSDEIIGACNTKISPEELVITETGKRTRARKAKDDVGNFEPKVRITRAAKKTGEVRITRAAKKTADAVAMAPNIEPQIKNKLSKRQTNIIDAEVDEGIKIVKKQRKNVLANETSGKNKVETEVSEVPKGQRKTRQVKEKVMELEDCTAVMQLRTRRQTKFAAEISGCKVAVIPNEDTATNSRKIEKQPETKKNTKRVKDEPLTKTDNSMDLPTVVRKQTRFGGSKQVVIATEDMTVSKPSDEGCLKTNKSTKQVKDKLPDKPKTNKSTKQVKDKLPDKTDNLNDLPPISRRKTTRFVNKICEVDDKGAELLTKESSANKIKTDECPKTRKKTEAANDESSEKDVIVEKEGRTRRQARFASDVPCPTSSTKLPDTKRKTRGANDIAICAVVKDPQAKSGLSKNKYIGSELSNDNEALPKQKEYLVKSDTENVPKIIIEEFPAKRLRKKVESNETTKSLRPRKTANVDSTQSHLNENDNAEGNSTRRVNKVQEKECPEEKTQRKCRNKVTEEDHLAKTVQFNSSLEIRFITPDVMARRRKTRQIVPSDRTTRSRANVVNNKNDNEEPNGKKQRRK